MEWLIAYDMEFFGHKYEGTIDRIASKAEILQKLRSMDIKDKTT